MTNHSLTQKNMTNYNIVLPTVSVSKHNNNNHSKAGPKINVKEPQHHNKPSSKPKSKKQPNSPSNEKQELTVVTNNNNKQVKKKGKTQPPVLPFNANNSNNNINKKPQQQQQQQQKPHHQQQRRNVMPVKVRRVERRKDIVSMTEALQSSQTDLLSASPPVSSTESSDDSDSGRTEQKSFKKKPNLPSPASFPPLAKKSSPRRQQGDKKVYAGATFNNAPDPSTLPLPSLSESQPSPSFTHQEASSHLHHQQHEDIFFMEVIPPHPHHFQLPPPQYQHPHFHQMNLQQQSRDLMSLLAPQRQFPLSPMVVPNPPVDHTLSQIQRDLRSMLKLEAAS